MDQLQPLINQVTSRVELSEDEIQTFVSCFKVKKVKKRQFIIQPDFVAKYRNFVLEGAFRAYVVADEGQDHTITFAIEDWWITDYNSYIFQQPATMIVVALEDSIILQIDYEKEQELKGQNHKFETFFRMVAERGLAFQQRRIISNLIHTAEERYENYVSKYPLKTRANTLP
jgi:CRP-like cAMP-binding protein